MARKSLVFLAMGTMILFLCSVSSADVPDKINYQGKLTTAQGGCLNDTVSMTFTIYSDDQGTVVDWTEDQDSLIVKEGIFNVLLGSVDPIPASVFDGSTKYLGVQVESDPEMRPLKPMVSVAYAYRAGANGGWVDDGTVVRLENSTDLVGIGTTSPGAKLQVGDGSSDDFIRVMGSTAAVGAEMGSYMGGFGYLKINDDGGTTTALIDPDGGVSYVKYGNIGIGTTSPSGKLHVASPGRYSGYFTSDSLSSSTHVIHSEVTGSGNENTKAVYGRSRPADGWGYGGLFEGGYVGVQGEVNPTGNGVYGGVYGYVHGGSGTNQGVYGHATGGSMNFGVYGYAFHGTYYGVYYSGGLAGSGSKSCVVKTSQGPTLLYCQESPENWFEDFGEGQLINGRTRIELDDLFLETVTIDDANPMKVFVQLEGDCNGVYVSKGMSGFDVIELKAGTSSVPFSYRVVAKRKGFEDKRLDYTAAGKHDRYLYPEAAERMEKERLEKTKGEE